MPDVSETGTPVMQFAGELWRACEDGDLNARWVGDSGNSHCYMLFNKKKTWFSARRSCENLNGHLVTVTSHDEASFLAKSVLAQKFDDWMGPWIGYSDARVEGQFEWVNGETGVIAENTVYSNWYENMPDNNNQGEDCAHVSGGQWGNKWNDMKCSNKLPYVCEREF
jgi:hypothetical protein